MTPDHRQAQAHILKSGHEVLDLLTPFNRSKRQSVHDPVDDVLIERPLGSNEAAQYRQAENAQRHHREKHVIRDRRGLLAAAVHRVAERCVLADDEELAEHVAISR